MRTASNGYFFGLPLPPLLPTKGCGNRHYQKHKPMTIAHLAPADHLLTVAVTASAVPAVYCVVTWAGA